MLFQIVIVISDIVYQDASGQIENSGGGGIDEIPVVGDVKHGACIAV